MMKQKLASRRTATSSNVWMARYWPMNRTPWSAKSKRSRQRPSCRRAEYQQLSPSSTLCVCVLRGAIDFKGWVGWWHWIDGARRRCAMTTYTYRHTHPHSHTQSQSHTARPTHALCRWACRRLRRMRRTAVLKAMMKAYSRKRRRCPACPGWRREEVGSRNDDAVHTAPSVPPTQSGAE